MITKILKKIFFKDCDEKAQERILKLLSPRLFLKLLTFLMLYIIIVSPYIFTLIIGELIPKDVMPLSSQIGFCIFTIIFFLLEMFFCFFFKYEISLFVNSITSKLHFNFCTNRGNAISKKDFKRIKEENFQLYRYLSTEACRGKCYYMAFDILKLLKRGSLKFIAVYEKEKENGKEYDYTAHVLYVNNGWAFDTYSQRQFPVKELLDIFEAKEYKEFSYKELENLSHDEFRENVYNEFSNWCKENNVYEKWYP